MLVPIILRTLAVGIVGIGSITGISHDCYENHINREGGKVTRLMMECERIQLERTF